MCSQIKTFRDLSMWVTRRDFTLRLGEDPPNLLL